MEMLCKVSQNSFPQLFRLYSGLEWEDDERGGLNSPAEGGVRESGSQGVRGVGVSGSHGSRQQQLREVSAVTLLLAGPFRSLLSGGFEDGGPH